MKFLWRMSIVLLLILVGEALFHPLNASTEVTLEVGMPLLGVFILLSGILSIQIAVRSRRRSKSARRKMPKSSYSYGDYFGGDGGFVATVDTSCAPDGGGSGDGGGGGGGDC